jgi:hypothetical protein
MGINTPFDAATKPQKKNVNTIATNADVYDAGFAGPFIDYYFMER